MDNLPNGGKVVIVDDCFQEILHRLTRAHSPLSCAMDK